MHLGSIARRSVCAMLFTAGFHSPPASAITLQDAKARYCGTKSGLLYFDLPVKSGNGFDEIPCGGQCLKQAWIPDPDDMNMNPAPVLSADGEAVQIDYREPPLPPDAHCL
jgi:hypothetical protein